jgi:hypothetical protein
LSAAASSGRSAEKYIVPKNASSLSPLRAASRTAASNVLAWIGFGTARLSTLRFPFGIAVYFTAANGIASMSSISTA